MSFRNGHIKLHRRILDWEWYDDSNVFRVFLHCLLKANWCERKWRGLMIGRGTFFTSYAKIGKELKISVQNARTAISKLKSTGELTTDPTGRGLLITVCKYDDYQLSKSDDQQASNRLLTGFQQASNRLLTTTEEIEEEEEIEEVLSPSLPAREETIGRTGFPEKAEVIAYCEKQKWPIESGLSFWLHFDERRSNGEPIGPNWHWWSRLEKWIMDDHRKTITGNGRKNGGSVTPQPKVYTKF